MKRRVLAFILCLCVMLSAAALCASATVSVCFISINDTLLELSSMPYIKSGVTYVPYWVFSNFGIGYSYFNEGSTAMLYQGEKIIFFDLINGYSYDIDDVPYRAQGILRNGVVYLPVQFMQDYFSTFTYSYIQGGAYGDIVRLKDSTAILSDSDFAKAAASLMRSRYNAYVSSLQPSPAPIQPTPTLDPGHEGTRASVSFIGLPSEAIFSALRIYEVPACFYLTAEDIRSAPDTVRRIVIEGHHIGILCTDNFLSEYKEASALLFETARTRTVMVTSLGDNAAELAPAMREKGLSFWYYNLDGLYKEDESAYAGMLTAMMDERDGDTSVFFSCDKTTENLLQTFLRYLIEDKYTLVCPGETDVWDFS